MPLEILGRDMRHVSVMHTGQVQVEITCEETGEKTVKTRDVNAAYYLNPFHDECVTAEEMLESFFDDKQYLSFLPDGTVDEDDLGELPNGIQVEAKDVIVVMIHASAGNWHHFFHDNVINGKVGYLSGSEYAHLCAGKLCHDASENAMLSCQLPLIMHSPMHTPVIRMHAMHFPNRNFDLNTLFCMIAMENALQRLYKLSPEEARAKVLDAQYCKATKILATLLFTAIIVRMTGRPMALEQWSEQFHKNKNADDSAGTVELPYLPDCVLAEVNDLTDFVLRTCTDSCGRVGRMTNWMGHGDASSIPSDLKNAKLFCSFLTGLLPIIHSAANQLVDLARNVATNPSTKNARESAVKIVQQLIESQLQKDKVKGSEFKSHQVQNTLDACLFVIALSLCPHQPHHLFLFHSAVATLGLLLCSVCLTLRVSFQICLALPMTL